MGGFNYGGYGDGTNWSKERGDGPAPGGGSHGTGGGNSGGSGQSNSALHWSVMKTGDTYKSKWGTVKINGLGDAVMDGVVITYENSSLVEDERGMLVYVLNSKLAKETKPFKNYGNNESLTNKKRAGKNPVSEYAIPKGIYESFLKGVVPNGYWINDGKVMTRITETYEINGGGKGNDRIGTRKRDVEIASLTNAYERGKKGGGTNHNKSKQAYAPPLTWGPWVDLGESVGRNVYTVNFDTESDAPSSFDVQIEYAGSDGMKSIKTMGPGSYQITDNYGAGKDRARFKSHSIGQNIKITY